MKNKKANTIPIILLVVGTIAICVLALLAFNGERDRRVTKVGSFKQLRIMYNVLDDMEFTRRDLNYVKKEFHPDMSFAWWHKNYYPIVKDINETNGRLVYEADRCILEVPIE